jgi:hypothetical protein
MAKHTDDIYNVEEGDSVTITTSEGETFDAECNEYHVEHADERTGEVRTTMVWFFDAVEHRPAVNITRGLKSSDDDPDFPQHHEMFDLQQEGPMGYIEELKIHGKR